MITFIMLLLTGIGLAAQIPNNLVMILTMVLFKGLFGMVAPTFTEMVPLCCELWFPAHFDAVLGVINSGFYLGTCVLAPTGGALYDWLHSFTIPCLVISAGIALCLVAQVLILPAHNTAIITKEEGKDFNYETLNSVSSSEADTEKGLITSEKGLITPDKGQITAEKEQRLSLTLSLPLITSGCFDLMYGYTQAIVCSYVNHHFGVSISLAGVYILLLSLSMGLGSICCGSILQHRVLTPLGVIPIAGVIAMSGVFLLFPGPVSTRLLPFVPKMGYISVCMIGFAAMLGSIAAFRSMAPIQRALTGKTPNILTKLVQI